MNSKKFRAYYKRVYDEKNIKEYHEIPENNKIHVIQHQLNEFIKVDLTISDTLFVTVDIEGNTVLIEIVTGH